MPADDALQSFLCTYGEQRTATEETGTSSKQHGASIPQRHSTCCCGNASCAYLQQNQASLDDLEQDVRHAAKLGQVCATIIFHSESCAAMCACESRRA